MTSCCCHLIRSNFLDERLQSAVGFPRLAAVAQFVAVGEVQSVALARLRIARSC